MRNLFRLALVCALIFGCGPLVLAEDDPSEQFLDAYMAVQQAEKLEREGKLRPALTKYKYAASVLDQIREKSPNWQQPVVDYRKKRTAQNILDLEKKVGRQSPEEFREPAPLNRNPSFSEPDLPTEGQGLSGKTKRTVGEMIKEQAEGLQRENDDLKAKLTTLRTNEAELKARLNQAEVALANSRSDNSKDSSGKKAVEKKVQLLKDELHKAQAERSAAEEHAQLNNDRIAKVKSGAIEVARKEVKGELSEYARKLEAAIKERDSAIGERDAIRGQMQKLTTELSDARNQIGVLTKERDDARQAASTIQAQLTAADEQIAAYQQERDAATTRAEQLTTRLSEMQQKLLTVTSERETAVKDKDALAKQLTDIQQEVSTLTADRENAKKTSVTASQKLTDAQKQIALLQTQRDESEKENDKLAAKLAAEEKKVATITADRNAMARERDDALAQVAKIKEAQKHVDKLLADNTALTKKLSDAEIIVKQFNSEMPKKDEQIAMLKKEVGGVKSQLESARVQNSDFQASISKLQEELDRTATELDQVKSEGMSSQERTRFTTENELLKGIVLREMKEMAKRADSRKIILDELARKEIDSDALRHQIDLLAEPVIKLTDQEKALFKQPQLTVKSVDDGSKVEISVAKTPTEPAATPKAGTPPVAKAAASSTPGKTLPKATPDTPDTSTVAKLTTPEAEMPSKGATSGTGEETPRVQDNGFTPTVPDELLPSAREAKDYFERGNYRETEKTYEKMLSKAPNNVYILSNLGVVRFRMNKLKLAEEAFKKAIAIAPKDAFSHCTLGIVYYSQGRDDDAINELTKSIAINSKNPTAHNYLAITAARKGWPEAALKEEQAALALDPNYPDAHFNLAVIYATGQPPNKEMARKHYDLAIKCGAVPDADLEKLIK